MSVSNVKNMVKLRWLGVAGFVIFVNGYTIVIDPYLSNSLAKKYAGTKFPHKRMMEAPFTVDTLPEPDLVLITHAHTDHMDPETLAPLHARFPGVPIIVPRAVEEIAENRVGSRQSLQPIEAGDIRHFSGELAVTAFPAAHEELDVTPEGLHPYLGYGIEVKGVRLYHSGDTVPFEEMTGLVGSFAPDIALLPINGRDAFRLSNGVPGNMTGSEALELCRRAKIKFLVPHHFGMFEFNTADPNDVLPRFKRANDPIVLIPNVLDELVISYLKKPNDG